LNAANPHQDDLEQCLTFVAAHLTLPVSEAAVRAHRVGNESPLTPDGFIDAAKRHGMVAALGEHTLATLGNSLLPAVALLKNGRAVVLIERIDEERFALFDPALGKQPVETNVSALEEAYIGHLIAVRARYRPVSLN